LFQKLKKFSFTLPVWIVYSYKKKYRLKAFYLGFGIFIRNYPLSQRITHVSRFQTLKVHQRRYRRKMRYCNQKTYQKFRRRKRSRRFIYKIKPTFSTKKRVVANLPHRQSLLFKYQLNQWPFTKRKYKRYYLYKKSRLFMGMLRGALHLHKHFIKLRKKKKPTQIIKKPYRYMPILVRHRKRKRKKKFMLKIILKSLYN